MKIRNLVPVAAVGALVLITGGSAANAADQPDAVAPANSCNSACIIDGSVWQADVAVPAWNALLTHQADASIWQRHLAAPLQTWLRSTDPGSIDETKLTTGVQDQLELGKQGNEQIIEATPITTIGGSFATGKTGVGSLDLWPGTWLVNATVRFDRLDEGTDGYLAPTTDTMPQFAIRYGDSYDPPVDFGSDAGTIMGVPVSRKGFVELTGSSVKTVTLAEDTTLHLYAFGYNEDRSGFGGGQITVSGKVSAVRVG